MESGFGYDNNENKYWSKRSVADAPGFKDEINEVKEVSEGWRCF